MVVVEGTVFVPPLPPGPPFDEPPEICAPPFGHGALKDRGLGQIPVVFATQIRSCDNDMWRLQAPPRSSGDHAMDSRQTVSDS